MGSRSLETRLQKLEGDGKGGGRFIVMSYRNEGTPDGAKAFYEESTGFPVDAKDGLVLIRRFYEAKPGTEPGPMPPTYQILTNLEPGALRG